MRIKVLILVGFLIIAFALLTVPVAADGASDTATLTGTLDSSATMTIGNETLHFATFAVGSRNISPSVHATEDSGRAFADLQVSSNEASWHVYGLAANSGKMKSTTTATTLTRPLNLDIAYAAPADFTKHNVVLSGSPQVFLDVAAQKLTTVSVPLDLGQDVVSGDPADTYSTVLTLQFSAT